MAMQISLTLPTNGAQGTVAGARPSAPQASPSTADTGVTVQESHPQPAQQREPDAAKLTEAVDTINRKLQESNQQLRFAVDHDSGKMVVRVVDTATDQVIRQIPSDVALAISQSLEKLQGLLVRQQA
jgi:flagellar protein FlaG